MLYFIFKNKMVNIVRNKFLEFALFVFAEIALCENKLVSGRLGRLYVKYISVLTLFICKISAIH